MLLYWSILGLGQEITFYNVAVGRSATDGIPPERNQYSAYSGVLGNVYNTGQKRTWV